MTIRIRLYDITKKTTNINPNDAKPVYRALLNALRSGEDVKLYFNGTTRVIWTFLNEAIARLYNPDVIDREIVEKKLSFPDADYEMMEMLNMIRDNAIKFYANNRGNILFTSVSIENIFTSEIKHLGDIDKKELMKKIFRTISPGIVFTAVALNPNDKDSFYFRGIRVYCLFEDIKTVCSCGKFETCQIFAVDTAKRLITPIIDLQPYTAER